MIVKVLILFFSIQKAFFKSIGIFMLITHFFMRQKRVDTLQVTFPVKSHEKSDFLCISPFRCHKLFSGIPLRSFSKTRIQRFVFSKGSSFNSQYSGSSIFGLVTVERKIFSGVREIQ